MMIIPHKTVQLRRKIKKLMKNNRIINHKPHLKTYGSLNLEKTQTEAKEYK